MPTFTGKTFASFYKNILGINQSSNTGVDTTTREVHDGNGQTTSVSLSDDVLSVKPVNDNSVGTLLCKNQSSSNILAVDTTNSQVLVGSDQINATTLFKEMGLYEFSPSSTGYHYPLIANRVGMQGEEALTADNDWGNVTDPPTSIDVSALTDSENAIAIYWYLQNSITLDAVRYMCISDGSSETLNFHLFSYDMDVSTNHGDLSGGVVCANASETSATTGQIRTGSFTLDSADIAANKVVIGFAEASSSTDDFSVSFNIKYHIQ